MLGSGHFFAILGHFGVYASFVFQSVKRLEHFVDEEVVTGLTFVDFFLKLEFFGFFKFGRKKIVLNHLLFDVQDVFISKFQLLFFLANKLLFLLFFPLVLVVRLLLIRVLYLLLRRCVNL